jgi:ATP-dependent RNA helicase DDX27
MEESDEASASSGSEMHDEDDSEREDESFQGIEDSEGEEDPLATSDEDKDEEDKEDEEENVEDDDDDGDSSEDESEEETQAEKDRKAAFFASEAAPSEDHSSFVTMNLSRPLLKSITALGFSKPTPIQAATVPVALLGKDVVGNAVTGSGKTAAFIIPMIERLLYRERGKNAAATRCLVLVPTRELGVQCYEVGTKLAKFTDIRFCLIVGMYSICIKLCAPYLIYSRWIISKGARGSPENTTRRHYRHTWSADRPHSEHAHVHPRYT